MNEEDFARCDATELAASVRAGSVKASELVDLAAAAIERLNPVVNAITYECLDEARAASLENLDGPFAGVPILLKDLGAEAAGHPSHQGNATLAELGLRHEHDSWVVQRLRAAGFLIVGRSNVPEFGLVSDSQNVTFGPTRNPWDLVRAPGGSSGGSASAVACGMVPLAHGTDGAGSIRMPASACGLVGHKPSRGLISDGPSDSDPMFGHSTNGVLTRSVRDTAAVLDLLAGPGPGDPIVAPRPVGSLLAALDHVERLKIGYVAETPSIGRRTDPEVVSSVEQTALVLSELGHEVVQSHPRVMFDPTYWDRWFDLLSAVVDVVVSDMELRAQAADVAAVHDTITAMWRDHGRALSASDHTRALLWLNTFRRDMAEWWSEGFDVLLSPTTLCPPLPIGHYRSYENGPADSVRDLQFTPQFNTTGAPAVSVPSTWSREGVPIGVQLVGRYGEDHVILGVAAQLERVRPWAHRYPASRRA